MVRMYARHQVADYDAFTYQRAFEAVAWSMPAIAIYRLHRASAAIGAGPNVILVPTEDKRPLPVVRFRGPTDDYHDRTREMPDVKPVE